MVVDTTSVMEAVGSCSAGGYRLQQQGWWRQHTNMATPDVHTACNQHHTALHCLACVVD
jgi:hypothetical protein